MNFFQAFAIGMMNTSVFNPFCSYNSNPFGAQVQTATPWDLWSLNMDNLALDFSLNNIWARQSLYNNNYSMPALSSYNLQSPSIYDWGYNNSIPATVPPATGNSSGSRADQEGYEKDKAEFEKLKGFILKCIDEITENNLKRTLKAEVDEMNYDSSEYTYHEDAMNALKDVLEKIDKTIISRVMNKESRENYEKRYAESSDDKAIADALKEAFENNNIDEIKTAINKLDADNIVNVMDIADFNILQAIKDSKLTDDEKIELINKLSEKLNKEAEYKDVDTRVSAINSLDNYDTVVKQFKDLYTAIRKKAAEEYDEEIRSEYFDLIPSTNSNGESTPYNIADLNVTGAVDKMTEDIETEFEDKIEIVTEAGANTETEANTSQTNNNGTVILDPQTDYAECTKNEQIKNIEYNGKKYTIEVVTDESGNFRYVKVIDQEDGNRLGKCVKSNISIAAKILGLRKETLPNSATSIYIDVKNKKIYSCTSGRFYYNKDMTSKYDFSK